MDKHIFEVELPNGEVLEIEAPEDTAPDAIRARAHQYMYDTGLADKPSFAGTQGGFSTGTEDYNPDAIEAATAAAVAANPLPTATAPAADPIRGGDFFSAITAPLRGNPLAAVRGLVDRGADFVRGIADADLFDAIQRGTVDMAASGIKAGGDFIDRTVQQSNPLLALGEQAGADVSALRDPLGVRAASDTAAAVNAELTADRNAVMAELPRPSLTDFITDPAAATRGLGARLATQGTESVPAFALALASRNPELGANLLGGVTGLQDYTDLTGQGVDPRTAIESAALSAAVEAAGEGFSLPKVMAKGPFGGLLDATLVEGGQELPVSIAQTNIQDQATGQSTPIVEQLLQGLEAAASGAGMGLGGYAVNNAPSWVAGRESAPANAIATAAPAIVQAMAEAAPQPAPAPQSAPKPARAAQPAQAAPAPLDTQDDADLEAALVRNLLGDDIAAALDLSPATPPAPSQTADAAPSAPGGVAATNLTDWIGGPNVQRAPVAPQRADTVTVQPYQPQVSPQPGTAPTPVSADPAAPAAVTATDKAAGQPTDDRPDPPLDIRYGKARKAPTREELAARETELRQRYAPAELVEAAPVEEASHADPGEAAEPVTPAVVAEAVQKSADNTPRNLKQSRDWLLSEIDKASASARSMAEIRMPAGEKYRGETAAGYRERMAAEQRQAAAGRFGYVTLDVPGDGKFKVVNSREALADFRAKVAKSQGFREKVPPPRGPRLDTSMPAADRARIMAQAETVDEAPAAPAPRFAARDANVPADLIAARDAADARMKAASAAMDAFPKGAMGITPDAVKASREWRAAKAESERALASVQKANAAVAKARKGAPAGNRPAQARVDEAQATAADRPQRQPTSDDVLESVSDDRAANFRRWSNGAPLIHSATAMEYEFRTGEKVVLDAFHGAKRPDRIGKGFNAKRATSGPMAYFTSAPDVASNYATGKSDTSLAYEDTEFASWFKVKVKGARNPVAIDRAWWSLDPAVRQRIAELAPRVQMDDAAENVVLGDEGNTNGLGNYEWELKQARGNHLRALVESWLASGSIYGNEQQFMDVLALAGMPMDAVTFDSPHAEFPAVFPVHIAMRNPLVSTDIPAEVMDALRAAAKRDRGRPTVGADAWDKRTTTLREWVSELEAGNDYVWTRIPDKVTDVLRGAGYDGIIDMGGKGGGPRHRVYVPFTEGQVKSRFNKGKYDESKRDLLERTDQDVSEVDADTLTDAERAAFGLDDRTASLRAAVDAALGPVASQVKYLRSWRDLPQGRLRNGVESRLKQRGGEGQTAALFDPKTGAVYLFTDANPSPERAVFNVLHEIAGHKGLRALLGKDLDKALDLAAQNPTVLAVAEAIALERGIDASTDAGQRLAVEEALAELAAAVRTGNYDLIADRYGVTVPQGIRERVAAAVTNFLRRLKALLDGKFGQTFSDADVRALLENAWQAAQTGNVASDMDPAESTAPDQTKTPEFRRWFGDSKVVDANGKPLVVYHGTTAPDFHVFRPGAQPHDAGIFFTSSKSVARNIYGQGVAQLNVAGARERLVAMSDDAFAGLVRRLERTIRNFPLYEELDNDGNPRGALLDYASDIFDPLEGMGQRADEILDAIGVSSRTGMEATRVVEAYLAIHDPLEINANGDEFDEDQQAEWIAKAAAEGRDGLIIRNYIDGSLGGLGNLRRDPKHTVYIAFRPEQIKSATANRGTFNPDSPSILESVAEAEGRAEQRRNEAAGELPVSRGTPGWHYDESRWEGRAGAAKRARMELQDKMLAWRDVQNQVEGQVGRAIPDAQNVYRAETLMHGRVAERLDRIERDEVKPLLEAMKAAKVSPETLEEYLYARHAKERNAKIAAINPAMPAGGSGMTDAAADAILANADRARLAPLADRVDAIIRNNRRRLLGAGLITQEAHDAMAAQYQHYVPLRGKPDTTDLGGTAGRGIDTRRQPVKQALGRRSRAANILGEVIGDAQRGVILAEKARVGKAVMRLVLANPNPDLWTVEPVQTERALDANGEVYERVVNDWSDPSVVAVRVAGKLYKVQIQQPQLAQALNNVGVDQLGAVTRAAGAINRYFSAVLTKYNPAFVPVNATRDALFGLTGLAVEKGEAVALDAALHYPQAILAAGKHAAGASGTGQWDQWAREFAEAGGKTGYVAMPSVEDLQRQVANVAVGGSKARLVGAVKPLVDTIGVMNDAVENALRLSAYVSLRKRGESAEAAAEHAKNLTVNFNRKGFSGSKLNAWFLFYNAALQGAHRTSKLLRNPKTYAYLGALAGAQVIAAMFAMGLEDDEGEPLWNKVPDHVKRRNLVIVHPSGTIVTVPMPYGFNLFTYMAGRSVDVLMSKERKASNSAASVTADLLSAASESFVPVPIGDGALGFLPTVLRIPTNIQTNRNDFGRAIRTEQPYAKSDVPRASMGRPDTLEVFKLTATGLNRLGGGDAFTPPPLTWFDFAPEDLEYLVGELTGGTGKFVVDVATVGQQATGGKMTPDLEPKDIPITKRFVTNIDEQASQRARFYERRESIDRGLKRVRNTYRMKGPEAAEALLAAMPELSGATFKRRKRDSDNGEAGSIIEVDGSPQIIPSGEDTVFGAYKAAEKAMSGTRERIEDAFTLTPAGLLPSAQSRQRDASIRTQQTQDQYWQSRFNALWVRDVVGGAEKSSAKAPDKPVRASLPESRRAEYVGIGARGAGSAAPDVLKGAKNAPKLVMVGDWSGLPRDVAETFDGGAVGAYDPNTRTAYVAMGMGEADAKFVAYHEIAGHHGLRGALGDGYEDVLNRAMDNPTVKKLAEAMLTTGYADTPNRLARVEEALADLAAARRSGDYARLEELRGVKIPAAARPGVEGMLNRVVQLTKRKLADLVGDEPKAFNDEQVYSLIEDAWQYVEHGR